MVQRYQFKSLLAISAVVITYLIWATRESFPISALIWPGVTVSRWLDLPFLAAVFALAEWAFRVQAAWMIERHGETAEDLAVFDGCLAVLIVLLGAFVAHLGFLTFMQRTAFIDASMAWAFAGGSLGCLLVVSLTARHRRAYRKECAAQKG